MFNKKLKKELELEIYSLKAKLLVAERKIGNPKYVVEKVLKRGVNWYDINQVESEEQRRNYAKQAESILKNEAFKNEINSIIADLINFCAKESPNHDKTLGARMSINAFELLRERLENITVFEEKKTPELDDIDKLYNEHYN